jgi:TPR repeat protein
MAAHPEDPNRIAPGVSTSAMDLAGAVAACRADLTRDPANPRLAYQLGRALTYSGKVTEALPFLEKSATAGYPQALFVTGYLYLTGAYGAPKDDCRGGELVRASALAGRMAGQIGFPKYYLDGRFRGCAVPQDPAEMVRFLEAAIASKPDYYPSLLADVLLRTLRNTAAPRPAP